MTQVYIRQPVKRLNDGTQTRHNDTLVTEEPLKLCVADRPLAITMRTQIHPACSDAARRIIVSLSWRWIVACG
jgi:formate dehydrogenase assembly factor FdhD